MKLINNPLVTSAKKARHAIRGDEALDLAEAYIARFCCFPDEHCLPVVTLWAGLSHMAREFETSPRLAALSPEPGSGKTRVLEILENLCADPMFIFGASSAALFRSMSERELTLLFDEVDTIFTRRGKDDQSEDLRALLNVGYRNGATIPRCVGPQHQVEHFSVYGPAALAGLGDLPETLMSRAIVIRMRRRAPQEKIEPYRKRQHAREGEEIREWLAAWAEEAGSDAGNSWPELPDGIVDRLAEIWEPIIAVADAAGGHWPERARQAATYFAAIANERSPSLGIKLLQDLKTVFGDQAQMFTEDILDALNAMDESPWSNIKGEPLDARGLAYRLKQYGAQSRQIRVGFQTRKGYAASDLWDAWQRYVPPSTPGDSETSETRETDQPDQAEKQADVSHVSDVSDSGPPESAEEMPDRPDLFRICKKACIGTDVDPSQLCQDLIDGGDPVHCTPEGVAYLVKCRGGAA
jgi:hypothetical protein